MDNKSNSVSDIQTPIVAAIRHLLKPLIRLLLLNGISFPAFCDLVRSTYVKVAEKEFRLPAKPQTDSRISLLTGIHRREVNRLRNEQLSGVHLSQRASMSGLLLTIWTGHPEYLDAAGLPIPLPRLASSGEEKSFEAMVESISKNIRARAVLDEWLRQAIVTIDNDDRVHLSTEAFIQPQDIAEKAYYFSRNIHDHLAATVYNLSESGQPFLERCVFYDQLSANSVKELAEYSRYVGMGALRAFNKRAAELQKRDQDRLDAVHRTNFGIYNFSEAETSDEV